MKCKPWAFLFLVVDFFAQLNDNGKENQNATGSAEGSLANNGLYGGWPYFPHLVSEFSENTTFLQEQQSSAL
jgi:hypothetical protein